MSEVNKERVAMLVEALESGKYKQTTYRLTRQHSGGEMSNCCLGVACEVAIEHGANVRKSADGWTSYDNETHALPVSVQEWYGFDDSCPPIRWGDLTLRAHEVNDDKRGTFPEIAAAFRRTYLEA